MHDLKLFNLLSKLLAYLMRNYFPKLPSGAPLHTLSKLYDVPVGFVSQPPYFEAVYCFTCCGRRVAVAWYRMICLVVTLTLICIPNIPFWNWLSSKTSVFHKYQHLKWFNQKARCAMLLHVFADFVLVFLISTCTVKHFLFWGLYFCVNSW